MSCDRCGVNIPAGPTPLHLGTTPLTGSADSAAAPWPPSRRLARPPDAGGDQRRHSRSNARGETGGFHRPSIRWRTSARRLSPAECMSFKGEKQPMPTQTGGPAKECPGCTPLTGYEDFADAPLRQANLQPDHLTPGRDQRNEPRIIPLRGRQRVASMRSVLGSSRSSRDPRRVTSRDSNGPETLG